MQKEAKARIKINKLLEEAGWRFFKDENGPATIQLESHGEGFEYPQLEFDSLFSRT